MNMRKEITVFLVIILCLSVNSIVCAAPINPFSDIPVDSWIYNAINQLIKAGIVEGDSDGTFKDNKPLTRNEMAIIVGKAIARSDKADDEIRAIIDKLQTEFAIELANLGFRIYNLERKMGKVKIYGDIYTKYTHSEINHDGQTGLTNPVITRSRLYVKEAINDQWLYNVRMQNLSSSDYMTQNLILNEAYVSGKILGGTYALGRQGVNATVLNGLVYDGNFKGILTDYKLGKTEVITRYGRDSSVDPSLLPSEWPIKSINGNIASGNYDNYFNIEVKQQVGRFKWGAAYHKISSDYNQKIWEVSASTNISPLITLFSGYAKSDAANQNKAYTFKIGYKDYNMLQPGSYGIYTEYRHIEPYAIYCPTYDQSTYLLYDNKHGSIENGRLGRGIGTKGFEIAFTYVPWKNVIWQTLYYDGKATLDSSNAHTKYFYSGLRYYFY
jgi:hypothetical protein